VVSEGEETGVEVSPLISYVSQLSRYLFKRSCANIDSGWRGTRLLKGPHNQGTGCHREGGVKVPRPSYAMHEFFWLRPYDYLWSNEDKTGA